MTVPHIYFDECVDHGLLTRFQKCGFHITTLPDYRSRLFRLNELQQRLIAGERIVGYTEDEVRRALGHPV